MPSKNRTVLEAMDDYRARRSQEGKQHADAAPGGVRAAMNRILAERREVEANRRGRTSDA